VDLKKLIFENYSVVALVFSLIITIYTVFIDNAKLVESLLGNLLFINIGLVGIWAFLGHWFRSDETAKKIGWKTGSPFQKEVAAANLSKGILGILTFFIKGNFWIAAVIGSSIFLFLCGIGHLKELQKKNTLVFNAGSVLYMDFLIPILLVILLVLWSFGY